MDLTARQREIFDFIRRHQADAGRTPVLAEIAKNFAFSSVNAAAKHVTRLVELGLLEREEGAHHLRIPTRHRLDRPMLPLIGRIAAGTPITAGNNVDEHVAVDPALFRPAADFLCRVQGDSMVDVGVRNGDLVGIKLQSTAPNNAIVAACLFDDGTGDEYITLKRYRRQRNLVTLSSENAAKGYAPIVVDLRQAEDTQRLPVFRLAGVMAGLIRAGAPG